MNIFQVLSVGDGIFHRGFLDFAGEIYDAALRFVYWLITGVLQVIYTIESVFYYMAGLPSVKGLNIEGLGQLLPTIDFSKMDINSPSKNFLNPGLFGNDGMKWTLIVMGVVGVAMVAVFLIYACAKGVFNQEGKTEGIIKMSLFNTLKACLFIAIIPILIPVIIGTINSFLAIIFTGISQLLTGTAASEGKVANSISYQIYQSLFTISKPEWRSAFDSVVWEHPAGYDAAVWGKYVYYADPFGIQFFSVETIVSKVGSGTGAAINMSFDGDFAYLAGFVASLFTLASLSILTFRICERLFELLIDYVLVVPAISTMPLDNGQRFGTWMNLFTGRLLNFTGSVLAMLIYIFVLNEVSRIIAIMDKTISGNVLSIFFFKTILFLMVCIGGGFTCVKAGNMVAQLIGGAATSAEAQSLNQSMKLTQMGAGAVKSGIIFGAAAIGAGSLGGSKGTGKAIMARNGTMSKGLGGAASAISDAGGVAGAANDAVARAGSVGAGAIVGATGANAVSGLVGGAKAGLGAGKASTSALSNTTGGTTPSISSNKGGVAGLVSSSGGKNKNGNYFIASDNSKQNTQDSLEVFKFDPKGIIKDKNLTKDKKKKEIKAKIDKERKFLKRGVGYVLSGVAGGAAAGFRQGRGIIGKTIGLVGGAVGGFAGGAGRGLVHFIKKYIDPKFRKRYENIKEKSETKHQANLDKKCEAKVDKYWNKHLKSYNNDINSTACNNDGNIDLKNMYSHKSNSDLDCIDQFDKLANDPHSNKNDLDSDK